MSNTLIVGLQYGDEGKGRISECYGRDADWFIRFNGGPNAGHTVYYNGKKFALHHLPAGAVTGKNIALDTGMVINYFKLERELQKLNITLQDIHVNRNVHMIFDKHEHADSSGSGIGSTKSGIGPVYADRALRKGKRAEDFFIGTLKTNLYSGLPPIRKGQDAIYEGAQGVMLDIDYGCYPYVTSSSVFPSIVHNIDHRVGVIKAYTSRVGDGPPNVPEVDGLSELGGEFGTTTGRRRKSYWLIADEIEYAMNLLQPDELIVTKLDILKDIEIKIWEHGKLFTIGNLDSYKDFLVTRWPKIRYFSESPDGDLIRV